MNTTEYQEQCNLVQWLRLNNIFHFAVTNENNTYKQDRKYAMIAAVKEKKSGKVKGTSDMVVLLPNKILFIEMKRKRKVLKSGKLSTSNSKTSIEQLAFIDRVNKLDYAEGRVCFGFLESKAFIEENLKEK